VCCQSHRVWLLYEIKPLYSIRNVRCAILVLILSSVILANYKTVDVYLKIGIQQFQAADKHQIPCSERVECGGAFARSRRAQPCYSLIGATIHSYNDKWKIRPCVTLYPLWAPQPIITKLGTIDYFRDFYPHAELC